MCTHNPSQGPLISFECESVILFDWAIYQIWFLTGTFELLFGRCTFYQETLNKSFLKSHLLLRVLHYVNKMVLIRQRHASQVPELENVKSFTRTNINKPDFTPGKARKSRHFWHFKPTKYKTEVMGFLVLNKLSIYGSLSIDLNFFAHIFPKMACFC